MLVRLITSSGTANPSPSHPALRRDQLLAAFLFSRDLPVSEGAAHTLGRDHASISLSVPRRSRRVPVCRRDVPDGSGHA